MKKQIIYPTLISRLFATTLDLLILSIIITPIMKLLNPFLFKFFFHQFINEYQIDLINTEVAEVLNNPAFADYIHQEQNIFFQYLICNFAINLILMMIYFVSLWSIKGATIGKMLMRMRIVHQDTILKPSVIQATIRFISYSTGFIGIWLVPFTKNKQALHDIIARTTIIKK